MDKQLKLEHAFFKMICDGGASKVLKSAIRRALPSASKFIDIDDSLGKVNLVCQSTLFKFCDAGAQSIALSVQQAMRALADFKAPKLGDVNDPFLIECRTLYSFFVTVEGGPEGEKKGPQRLSGKMALLSMLRQARQKQENKEKLTYPDVAPMIAYGYLLDAADRKKVAELTKTATAVDVGTTAVASASSASSSQPAKAIWG